MSKAIRDKEKSHTPLSETHPFEADWDDSTLDTWVKEKRENKGGYYWFYKHILKYGARTAPWKKHVETGENLATNIATASDEALCLLCLENYWRVWKHKAGEQDGAGAAENALQPKYTVPKRQRDSWSSEGIKRFNKLVEEVRKDRDSRTGKAFDSWHKNLMETDSGNKGRRKRRRIEPGETAAVLEIDSSDDESEDGENHDLNGAMVAET
jgi:hypothetical protein